ncbi:MAG: HAMP domain-containing histidine kinase, partial [bacterium]|nr:HAMP domain-containing histidine kinase [bacterium]
MLFVVVGLNSGMRFESGEEKYGVYNLAAAVVIAIFCVFFLDNIRRRNYESHRAVHRINEELQSTFVELRTINEELEHTSIELSTKNEELRKANEIKSELLGIASHDLKNPLQVIIGYAGLLQERMKEDKFAHDRLGMIIKSSDKMLKLITELLETAATDRGRLKMNLTAVDVGKTADAVLKNIIYLAEKKNQEIFFSAEKECTVRGDKLLLQQVMDNLIGNAIK